MNLGDSLLIYMLFVLFVCLLFYFNIYRDTQKDNAFCMCKYLTFS